MLSDLGYVSQGPETLVSFPHMRAEGSEAMADYIFVDFESHTGILIPSMTAMTLA